MRKMILSLLLLISLATTKANAQVKDNLSLGPIAGFGHSWSNTYSGISAKKFNPSFNGGLRLTYSVVPHFGVGLDGTFKTEGSRLTNPGFKFIDRLNYISFDPKAWFFFRKSGRAFRPKIGVGPNFGFLTGGKRKEDVMYGQAGEEDSKDYFKTFNFGLAGATGFNYRLKSKTWLNMDAVYNHGLTRILKRGIDGRKTRSIFLNVGVTFGIGHAGEKGKKSRIIDVKRPV